MRTSAPLAASLVALCLAVAAGCSASAIPTDGPTATGHLRVAAAADLRYAMDDLVEAWAEIRPDVEVEPIYGSSGNYFAQISAGAPFDVYFSADIEYPRALEQAGIAPAGATRAYAIGQIVVWVRTASPLDVEDRGLDVLTDDSVQRIAIANPEHAPYGRAAVAALRAAGLYEAVESRIVLGENIAQTAQFVESGSADVGIIALSLALAPPLTAAGRYAIVPIDSYPTLEQGALVLESAADHQAATDFLDFVLGNGRTVLDRYGFLPPP